MFNLIGVAIAFLTSPALIRSSESGIADGPSSAALAPRVRTSVLIRAACVAAATGRPRRQWTVCCSSR